MQEERKKILEMVADGKISVDEAERLLTALDQDEQSEQMKHTPGRRPQYLRVMVAQGERIGYGFLQPDSG